MRIGISSYWFNRGQAVVARQLRSALDALGHETFVLARPTRAGNIRPAFIDRSGVWDQPGITEASAYEIPGEELEGWARERGLEVAFFDQNYQFEEIARLRAAGARTVGRFVWEQFSPEHTEPAKRAFEVVYSMTAVEQQRYADLGIDSPRVHWGCHPELLEAARRNGGSAGQQAAAPGRGSERLSVIGSSAASGSRGGGGDVLFFFPGGFMSKRKPVEPTIEAFRATSDPRLRLLIKSQVERGSKQVRKAARRDRRIELISEDLPADEHLRLFGSADVCLAPSRWEGLGLHLYEAAALALPIVTNDNPPMNEVVRDGVNGLLVRGVPSPERPRSGIPSFDPDREELRAAIERLADPGLRAELAAGAALVRGELSWERTTEDLRRLLDRLR
jgi:1,2-diacylglycerol 3-alpha-glucosyltransferase